MIFLFHSYLHLGCDYGIFNYIISNGALCMTTFFMLSGFVLSLTNQANDLLSINELKKFYIKRFINVIPIYWIVGLSYTFTLCNDSLKDTLILFPIETLGLQSFFSSLFSKSHNGGTWFVSCLILCYVLFPFIHRILKLISKEERSILLILVVFILFYSPIVQHKIDGVNWIYPNPFFRLLEFILGCILFEQWKLKEYQPMKSAKSLCLWGGANNSFVYNILLQIS